MKCLLVLFLLYAVPLAAQQVSVLQPDGTKTPYIPQRTRVVKVHDTVIVNRILVVHDTLRMFFATREIEKPYALNVQIVQPTRRDTVAVVRNMESGLGVFGLSTFRSNILGPAYSFALGPFRVFLVVGISYLSDYEKRQVIANAGIAGFAAF